MFESLKLSDISKKSYRVLRQPSSTRPILWVIEENGVRAVVKDFSSNSFLYRNTLGRFLVWREGKAYNRLRGLKGIPTLYRNVEGIALVIEEISGKDIETLGKGTRLSETFLRELRDLVETVHNRDVAHCDLKRAPNIMMGHDGKPYIVDWSAAIFKKEFSFFPLDRIYQRFIRDDLNAIIKIKLKYRPKDVSHEERRLYAHRNRAEKFIRTARDKARELLQKIA